MDRLPPARLRLQGSEVGLRSGRDGAEAPERTETAQELTLFADWEPGAYDRLD
ncbi:hypothetical protein [Streptomyces sp. NPDC002403]